MIIGNGDIAIALKEGKVLQPPERVYFASGVSNSQEKRPSEYEREAKMLSEVPGSSHLVYFSSLSILYSDTPYALHKRRMELKIKANFRRYTIIRLGNIDWGTNPHTLINYLRAHPLAEIQDVWRYVIDKDEFLYWIGMIPEFSCELNVPGRRLKVQQIWEEYVKH